MLSIHLVYIRGVLDRIVRTLLLLGNSLGCGVVAICRNNNDNTTQNVAITTTLPVEGVTDLASVPGLPPFVHIQFISACGAHINGEGLGLSIT